MAPLKTNMNTKTEDYQNNYKEMEEMVATLNERLQEASIQGTEKEIKRHHKRGQLLARDRVELLLDEDSPFLELLPLCGWGQDDMTIGGGSVAGIGLVEGVECLISANVSTRKGGAIDEMGLVKGTRLAEIAMENHLPAISLTQSAGANLSQQARVFHKGGQTFRELAIRSKRGETTVCVVFGSSTAGGAYQPGMSDYTVMVKDQAKVFLGGPPLVKMATGEEVDDETLGGADMHSRVSGVSDYLAKDELSAIRLTREIMANLNWQKRTILPTRHLTCAIEEPLYNPDELLGVVPANIRVPFDCREVIMRIVDGSRFSEFKPLYGSTLVCGFAYIHGIAIGILGNNGVLFVDSSNKGAQFIQLCNQKNVPLLFLQNITGFMVGSKYEKEGMIKAGSQFINAVSNSGVPAITIVMGASYGAGNYAMCGRAYKPRFLFSWPNSKCSVMGPEQLTGVMDIVSRGSAARRGQKVDEEKLAFQKSMFQNLVEEQSDVYYTTSRAIDDGVIDPRDTRDVIGMCLSIIYNNHVQGDNTSGISRL
eukprot:CAMPEP_0201517216 /NCGR_PEP_ID=MMETSP0161_2-20130828/8379_1 /ASSEMBLY_ACC=CAM_ASM_000251 /TAXON_ID=180227 /ORGANISM="Neoparamoeba aestuarina, Strain SoJaBio B1-5/56/2" /LENGTH=536 /DNA_ID=CAMNT_0047914641 /DNA_START=57 /DNA_END=1667 /DNA_ORIENTATION=+